MPRAGWLALGAVVAALLAGDLRPGVLVVALAGCLAVLAVSQRIRVAALGLTAGAAALIVARLLLGLALAGPTAVAQLPEGRGPWPAQVESLATPSGGYQRAIVVLLRESTPVGAGPVRLYARLPGYPAVVPGDRIRVAGRLQPPPDGAGFGDYLRRIGAAGTLEATSLDLAALADGPGGWLERRRRESAELLGRALPAPQAGFAAAMLVGLRDEVDRDVSADFTAAGLSHVIAISGWNIALVAGAIAGALGFLSRRNRSLVTLLAIAAYTLVAGAGASVVRAAVMAGLALTARISGRASQARTLLALAATAMLLVDPALVVDPGFQLSVAATAGLLAWATPLSAWLRRRLPRGAPESLVASLGVSLAAQAATLPLVLLDFGRLSLIAPAANLVAAPLVAPAMLTGAIALVASWCTSLGLPDTLQALGGAPAGLVLGGLIAVADLAAQVPGASLTLDPTVSLLAAMVSLAGVAAVARSDARRSLAALLAGGGRTRAGGGRARAGGGRTADDSGHGRRQVRAQPRLRLSRRTRVALGALLAALTALVLVAAARPDGRLRVTVLDVGQGDAILVEGPSGGRLLVDTGPDPDRLLVQLDGRIPTWDRRLDLVVLTHPHDDHVAGAALLLERYRVARLFDTGMAGTGPGSEALDAELAHLGRTAERLVAGDAFTLDGAAVSVRWPPPGEVPDVAPDEGSAVNNVSIVLDLRFGARRFLLTGDAEQDVDPRLLAAGLAADGTRVDVLKVAHHGSSTSTTGELLDAIRPRVAVISVGAGNTYGHPGAGTLARLAERGIATYRTDLDGSISLTTDGRDLRVETSRQRRTAARALEVPGFVVAAPVALAAFGTRAGDAPRIQGWLFLPASKLRGSCSASTRPPGSSPTSARLPRSPPSSPSGPSGAASTWTGRWSRRRRCCTTSTSCSRPTTRSRSSGTAKPVRAGSPGTVFRNSPGRSPHIP